MNKWMNEWINEWMNNCNKTMNEIKERNKEWMNKWMNEWINEWMNNCNKRMNEIKERNTKLRTEKCVASIWGNLLQTCWSNGTTRGGPQKFWATSRRALCACQQPYGCLSTTVLFVDPRVQVAFPSWQRPWGLSQSSAACMDPTWEAEGCRSIR